MWTPGNSNRTVTPPTRSRRGGNRLKCYTVHHAGPEFSVDCTGPVSFDIWVDCSNGTRYATDQVTTGNGARGVLVCPLGSKVTRGGGRQTSSE